MSDLNLRGAVFILDKLIKKKLGTLVPGERFI